MIGQQAKQIKISIPLFNELHLYNFHLNQLQILCFQLQQFNTTALIENRIETRFAYNKNMFILGLALLLLIRNSFGQSPYFHKTTVSNKYMNRVSFKYCYNVNGAYYSSWNIPMNTYYSESIKNNFTFTYLTSINSISSGLNTWGFQIPLRVQSIKDISLTLSIAASIVNINNGPLAWYSGQVFIFSLPKDVPFIPVQINQNLFSTIGQNLYSPTVFKHTQNLTLNPTFGQYCYYDSSHSIKDKVHLIPSLVQLSIQNPEYVNLTSSSNWQYDWDSTVSIPIVYFDIIFVTYISKISTFVMNVIGICPNSYKFVQYGYSIAVSPSNWFTLQPNSSPGTKYNTAFLEYPFSNDTAVILGVHLTGLSIHYQNFNNLVASAGTSSMLAQFNISPGNDPKVGFNGFFGNISSNIINPWDCYGFYWMFGNLGPCPSNLIQFNVTHCVCPPGSIFSYISATCLDCRSQYGPNCGTCNSTQCLSCTKNLYFYQTKNKTLCLNCSQLYGEQCSQCSDTTCLKCEKNYTVDNNNQCSCQFFQNFIDIISGMCTSCPLRFQFCINCTYNGCFDCVDRFTASNGSCLCFLPNILALGSCFSCPDLFGMGCILCNNTSCQKCDSNFQLINNSCKCIGSDVTLYQQKCHKCLDLFGLGCLSCNYSKCFSCDYNFQNNVTSCICPPVKYTVNNTLCFQCWQLYPYCVQCNNVSCVRCKKNFQLQQGKCSCSGDRYHALGGNCQICSNVHQNCISCNRSLCWRCQQNFTLVKGACRCLYPHFPHPNLPNSCFSCEDIKGSLKACQLSVRGEFYQSGKTLYFWLRFSRSLSEISFNVPIQYNTKVTVDGKITSFVYDKQTGIFTVDLSGQDGTSVAEVTIMNKQYVVSDGVNLGNDPSPFTVSQVNSSSTFDHIINTMILVKNYTILAIGLLSFGVYSKLFKTLTMITVICLSQANLPNSIGLISNTLNLNNPYQALPIDLYLPLQRIPSQELRLVAYGLNKPIALISLQLYIAALLSICLIAYVRGYLKTKKTAHKQRAFRNILLHSKQYLLQNLLSLHTLLFFPALLQIKLIYSLGLHAIIDNVINFGFAGFLLLTQLCLILVYIFAYRIDKYHYSVLYNQMRPNLLVFGYWLMSTLQPFCLAACMLFVSPKLNSYLIIGTNGLNFLLLIMCCVCSRSKISYFIDVVKSACLLYVSIALFFNGKDSLMLIIAAYCIIAAFMLEFVQILFKMVEMILRNKGIIADVAASQIYAEQKNRKVANLNELLSEVKNDLKNIIKNKKSRND